MASLVWCMTQKKQGETKNKNRVSQTKLSWRVCEGSPRGKNWNYEGGGFVKLVGFNPGVKERELWT